MDLDLKGVHILVTGASGGIGLETTSVFLEQGANVTAHYNTNKTTLQPLLTQFGPTRIQALQTNLTIEQDVSNLFAKASSSAFGPVQVVIINHAVSPVADQPVLNMEFLQGLEQASDDVKAYASILFVGSTAGKIGEAGHADYAASKSAMMYGLTMTLKNEIVKIAPRGRVNCIAPGWVKTPMAEESLKDPNVVYRALASTPLKKLAQASDIASQIVVLSSQRISGHISGEVIMITGGMEGRLLNFPQDL